MKVEKYYDNVMIAGRNLFDQSVNAAAQGDGYTVGCLLDYLYFEKYCKMIYLSKQQVLNANPKPIHKTDFTGNLYQPGNKTMFFIIEEAKETTFNFSQGTARV